MVWILLIVCIILGIAVWVYKSKYDNENWLRTKCENELNKTANQLQASKEEITKLEHDMLSRTKLQAENYQDRTENLRNQLRTATAELHKLEQDILSAAQREQHYTNYIEDLRNQLLVTEAQRDDLSSKLFYFDLQTINHEQRIHDLEDQLRISKKHQNELSARLNDITNLFNDNAYELKKQLIDSSTSNLTAIPYMASFMAEYETYALESLAQKLDWGVSKERAKKVKAIREIRSDAKTLIESHLEARYQLEYLLTLFPNLRDVIETDYKDLPIIDTTQISEYDRTRDWLSKEEYQSLSSIERNQLALDRYKESHSKTKWQIGRDYELYVGYRYTQKGFSVDYYGSYMGMEDLGRDLIAKKDDTILIVQCKYWSQIKSIHEKHINQLYGTMICYCIEHDLAPKQVKGVLVTNIILSDTAKKMANYLHIEYVENFELGDYPCIKCNIGHDEHGYSTHIYHLPFDQQYDATKIDAPGEFYAMTVQEAEDAGFRRAFKWFGSD